MKNEFQFRAWTRDCGYSEGKISKRRLDERVYLDIWQNDGSLVKQFLVPKGTEDAIFELVEAHSKQYPKASETEG